MISKIIIVEIVLIFVFAVLGISQGLVYPPREYVEFPAYSYPPASKELEQSVREFFSNHGDNTSFSFRARKHSKEIFLIKAETQKSVGWGLIARKIQDDKGTCWQINTPTKEDVKNFGW